MEGEAPQHGTVRLLRRRPRRLLRVQGARRRLLRDSTCISWLCGWIYWAGFGVQTYSPHATRAWPCLHTPLPKTTEIRARGAAHQHLGHHHVRAHPHPLRYVPVYTYTRTDAWGPIPATKAVPCRRYTAPSTTFLALGLDKPLGGVSPCPPTKHSRQPNVCLHLIHPPQHTTTQRNTTRTQWPTTSACRSSRSSSPAASA